MYFLPRIYIYKVFLLLLSTFQLSIEVTSTREGSSHFFYQQAEYPRDCKEALDQCSSSNLRGIYTIKPDGYPQPFEVYCNDNIESGGWTVIQRQIEGSLTFNRNWEDYKSGFGFLSGEYWIGHDKLSYLTNQAVYELRIDMVLSNGSSFYVKYNSFRISDEWSNYAVVYAKGFRSNWSCIVSTCPFDTTHDSCTCWSLCADPIRQTDCYNDCVETCTPKGCLVPEKNSFIPNGDSFINPDCTQNCTCLYSELSCNTNYGCSLDASCKVKDETRKCYCNDGYKGDGETCVRYTDCYDAYEDGQTADGVYTILPTGWTRPPFTVFCDMTTDGGGWTVFQRRIDGVTSFYRYWNDFKLGFGSRESGNDFWLGNEHIHYLTNQREYKLRVDIVTSTGFPKYAEYTPFRIGDESAKYRLSIGNYSGNAGNHLGHNNGGQFSTRDQDNDGCSFHHYAQGHEGGWWYSTGYPYWCQACYVRYTFCSCFETSEGCNNIGSDANLNGEYNGGYGKNIFWFRSNCNLNSTEMKIRLASV